MYRYLKRTGFSALLMLAALVSGCATGGGSMSGESEQNAPSGEVAQAYEFMRNGDYEAAEPTWLRIAKRKPKLGAAQINLGIVYANTGRADDALKALRMGLDLGARSAPAYNQLGIVLRERGDFAGAEAAYGQALSIDAGYANAHYNLGVLYDLYLVRPHDALASYQRYLDTADSQDPKVIKWIADLNRRTSSVANAAGVAQ